MIIQWSINTNNFHKHIIYYKINTNTILHFVKNANKKNTAIVTVCGM